MTRLPNWATLLDQFLRQNRSRRFEYGSFDCCLFVCDCIQVMTGVDVAVKFRGRYTTREEALALIHEATGTKSIKRVTELVTRTNQMPKVDVPFLQRGDVALIRRGGRDYSLAIVALNGRDAVVAVQDGLQWIPLASAFTGWRV